MTNLEAGELFWDQREYSSFHDGNEEFRVIDGKWVDGEECLAIDIIRRSTTYQDAYGEMSDEGIKNPDLYWHRYIDQCGSDVE